MIVLFGDPESGFAMSDGLVEPAEVGKHVAKLALRKCRLDHGRSETLSAQLALEPDVPLEQFGCFVVLAPDEMYLAKIVRCDDLEGAIGEGVRDGERLLPEFESCVVVASVSTLVHHEGGDSCESVLIAERPGEDFRLLEVISHAYPIAQRAERVACVNVDIDGQFASPAGLGQMAQRPKCLL